LRSQRQLRKNDLKKVTKVILYTFVPQMASKNPHSLCGPSERNKEGKYLKNVTRESALDAAFLSWKNFSV